MVESKHIERPFSAYKGDEPFLFICYAHDDVDIVYPEILKLHDAGINVWYDGGIQAGTEWREELAKAIKNASLFIYFIHRNRFDKRTVARKSASPLTRKFLLSRFTLYLLVYQMD